MRSDKIKKGIERTPHRALLYATGLRVSELVSLPLSAAVGEHLSTIIVKGKGGRERIVPLSTIAVEVLRDYLLVRDCFDNEKHNSLWLFPSTSKSGYLTRQRFAQLLKSLAIQANVDPGKVSPHVLRHAFATHLLNNGADLLSVQKMLGHADIVTTEIYTHVMGDRLKELVSSCHPLAKLSN